MGYTISVDTGGTFTDVVVRAPDGVQHIGKALTTQARVFEGMSEAIAEVAKSLGFSMRALLSETELVIYGTTRATNAIVTRRVAKTAFLTTQGFPDTLVLKEGGRRVGQEQKQPYPDPYIPRSHTFEVPERIGAYGHMVRPLDVEATVQVLASLKEQKFEAVAVCLLWSSFNPEHELLLGTLLEKHLPGVPYTLSHQISPTLREYRRASAAAIDASLKPVMQRHLSDLEADLRAAGYGREILVSTSIGGVMNIREIIKSPIHTAKSGPSMAPIAAISYSTAEGLGDNTIVCDTGGTTFDVGLSREGSPIYTRDTWLGGFWQGDILGISSVDIRSIGAGGGSIAWIDGGGLLRVGPQSAGSEPGPACYGRGGEQPTVSDAACVLGYINPANFLGGRMSLDVEAASRAMQRVAQPLSMSIEQAAWGVIQLASDHMVKAIHELTVFQGINPLECTLVAGGGAAGLNIMQIGAELGAKQVVLPKVASALSASGMQFADIVVEESASVILSTDRFDYQRFAAAMKTIEEALQAAKGRIVGAEIVNSRLEFFAEARYKAQVWDLMTSIPEGRIRTPHELDAFSESFHATHERTLGIRDQDSVIEVISVRGRLVLQLAKPSMAEADRSSSLPPQKKPSARRCFFDASWMETAIYQGSDMRPGQLIAGPAIIEEPTTTVVVLPGLSARVSQLGNYILNTEIQR